MIDQVQNLHCGRLKYGRGRPAVDQGGAACVGDGVESKRSKLDLRRKLLDSTEKVIQLKRFEAYPDPMDRWLFLLDSLP